MDNSLAFLGAFMGVLAVGFIVMYVVLAITLMKIAQKTNTDNAWLAWIPIANLFLIVFCAKKEWWWGLIILFAGIIPIIGSIASLAAMIYMWWLICEKLNKPGPLALLMLIPVVNLVFMLYLAFSK